MTSTGTAATIGGLQNTAPSPAHPAGTAGPSNRRLLRRGAGLTGTLGSLLVLGAFGVVGLFGLPDTSNTESLLRFPEIQYARAAENLLYLGGVVLWAVHFDLLHRLLRTAAPVLSTAARTVGLLGVAVLAAGTLLNVATAPMSQAYRQAGASNRAGIVHAWQAAQGVLDALLVTGALLLPVAVMLFGFALRRELGPVLRWGTVVVGAAGITGAGIAAATPPSALVAAGVLATLAFHLVVGLRWLQLSRS